MEGAETNIGIQSIITSEKETVAWHTPCPPVLAYALGTRALPAANLIDRFSAPRLAVRKISFPSRNQPPIATLTVTFCGGQEGAFNCFIDTLECLKSSHVQRQVYTLYTHADEEVSVCSMRSSWAGTRPRATRTKIDLIKLRTKCVRGTAEAGRGVEKGYPMRGMSWAITHSINRFRIDLFCFSVLLCDKEGFFWLCAKTISGWVTSGQLPSPFGLELKGLQNVINTYIMLYTNLYLGRC